MGWGGVVNFKNNTSITLRFGDRSRNIFSNLKIRLKNYYLVHKVQVQVHTWTYKDVHTLHILFAKSFCVTYNKAYKVSKKLLLHKLFLLQRNVSKYVLNTAQRLYTLSSHYWIRVLLSQLQATFWSWEAILNCPIVTIFCMPFLLILDTPGSKKVRDSVVCWNIVLKWSE